jgi:DNA repair exonuclease SbcCD ATPase subunit
MGPYDDWTLDTTKFRDDQKLIAIVGNCGRGKSFSLEASFIGAWWRDMPTQGKLVKRATQPDSLLESTIVHAGRRWTVRHAIDAVQSVSNVVVIGEDGEPLWKKAGPRVFDTWVDEHLPHQSVVLASLFSYQSSEGFVAMSSGDRIAVILRAIGVERLERKAKLARERAAETERLLSAVLQRIADVRGSDSGLAPAEAAAQEAQIAADVWDMVVEAAGVEVTARRQAAAE